MYRLKFPIKLNRPGQGQAKIHLFEFIKNKYGEKKRASFQTIPSYSEQIPFDIQHSYRVLDSKKEDQSPTIRVKRKASNLMKVETKSKISWNLKEKKQLPALQVKIKTQNMNSSILGFKLYRFYNGKTFAEFGQNQITLSELLKQAPEEKLKNKDEVREIRLVQLQKNLWNNGKNIGKCTLTFRVQNSTYIKQMNSYTNTEDGIINMAYYEFYAGDVRKKKSSNRLEEMYEEIVKMITLKSSTSSFLRLREVNEGIGEKLINMHKQLKNSLKDSYIFNSKKIRNQQILLINILKMLQSLIQETDMILGDICWNVCIEILKRGEIMLKNIGFSLDEIKKLKSQPNLPAQLQQKKDIGFQYQQIISKLLKKALETQVVLYTDQQIQNSQIFKVYCFFRVPLFRQILLEAICQTQIHLFQKQNMSHDYFEEMVKSEDGVCSWEENFFQVYEKDKKIENMNKNLQEFMMQCQWFSKMNKKDVQYFNFVKYLMSKLIVERKKQTMNEYQYFPGYNKVIKSYLTAFKERFQNEYSLSLELSALSLLENQRLFFPILKIMYESTNLLEKTSVIKLLRVVSIFLQELVTNKKIGTTFPYNYFMDGIKLILQIGSSIYTYQALIILYNFYEFFQHKFRYQLALYLAGKKFWEYYYHWSEQVRKVYHHILIVKIFQDEELSCKPEIRERIHVLEILIVNVQIAFEKRRKKSIEGLNSARVQKSLHAKMREKLKIMKKNKKSKQNQHNINDLKYESLSLPRSEQIYDKFFTIFEHNKLMEIQNNCHKSRSWNDSNDILDLTQIKLGMTKKLSYKEHRHSFQCFDQHELLVPEINKNIENYVSLATREFTDTMKLTEEFYDKQEKLPKVNFGFQIKLDEKEIRPTDFQINLVD